MRTEMNWNQSKTKKTIEVCTNKYQNYDLIFSFYDYCARLICKITKNSPPLYIRFNSCTLSCKMSKLEYAVEDNFNHSI